MDQLAPTTPTYTGCDDCYYKSPKVGSRGPVDSPFVVIGESPGIQEVIKGQPFVGPSGEVIMKTLEKVGCKVEPYFTNAVHCMPRRKDPENLAIACQHCHNHVIEEIKAYPRKVILAMGNGAIWQLIQPGMKITKERGKLFRSPLASVGIITAVHPAFLLRGGGNYTQFENDVRYAVQLLQEGEDALKLPDGTTYKILETKADVKEFNKLLATQKPDTQVACDIETTGFNHQSDDILCLGMHYAPKKSVIIPGELVTDELLAHKQIIYNWHNGKFDCRFLRYQVGPSAKVDDDTMLLSYALNERRGIHDLDQVSSDWLGSVNHKNMVDEYYKGFVIDAKTGLKRRRNLSDCPKPLLYKYLASDINDTYQLWFKLKPLVQKDKDLWKFYTQHLIPGSEYLLKLELNGMLVSNEWVLKNHYRLTKEIAQYRSELQEWAQKFGLIDFNPNSWQQVKTLLYKHLKLAPESWSTDDDTLETLPKHPAVKSLQNHRLVAKAHGTYVKPLLYGARRKELLPDSKKESVVYQDGRTHSSYLLHGTPTSRLACRDLNVQNIPRDPRLRGQFVARPGYGILECDYSQAELRSLACLSRCAALMDIYINDKDLHVEFSSYLFGKDYTHEEKMAAKTVNFGIPYGREAPSIASDPQLNTKMDITIALAQSWIDGWGQRFPGAWKFIEQCAMAPVRNQTIVTCFGNKKRPGVVSREKLRDLQNESRNMPHQSIASNLTVRAGIELFDLLRDEYDSHIINTVHDCLVIEVPLNLPHVLEVARVVTTRMKEIPARFPSLAIIPWKASAEFGKHWGNLRKLNQISNQSTCYLNSMPDSEDGF